MPAEIVEDTVVAPDPSKGTLIADGAVESLDDVLDGQLPDGDGATDENEVPEKYRGKTQRELVEMHQNAEAQMGRHSQEVGELRGVVDTFIRSQMEAQEQAKTEEEAPDFHLDPEAAVAYAVENHPDVKAAKAQGVDYQKATSQAQLQAKHPDMADILGDAKFAEWVKASPTRMRLYAEANHQFNFDSADELFSTYKERTRVVNDAAGAEAVARKDALKAASTGSAKASAAPASKKIFRRADIIKLMQSDRARYDAMQDEIMAAYKDKRVR